MCLLYKQVHNSPLFSEDFESQSRFRFAGAPAPLPRGWRNSNSIKKMENI